MTTTIVKQAAPKTSHHVGQIANHPNRSRNHILKICPRGFQNETTYVSVSDAEYAEADSYLDTLADDVNDTSCWLDPGTKLVNGAKVNYIWPRYKDEWTDRSTSTGR